MKTLLAVEQGGKQALSSALFLILRFILEPAEIVNDTVLASWFARHTAISAM